MASMQARPLPPGDIGSRWRTSSFCTILVLVLILVVFFAFEEVNISTYSSEGIEILDAANSSSALARQAESTANKANEAHHADDYSKLRKDEGAELAHASNSNAPASNHVVDTSSTSGQTVADSVEITSPTANSSNANESSHQVDTSIALQEVTNDRVAVGTLPAGNSGGSNDSKSQVDHSRDSPGHGQQNKAHDQLHRVEDRVFVRWPEGKSLPCLPFHMDQNRTAERLDLVNLTLLHEPTQRGMFFTKLVKTGSTTGSGVHLRIVRNMWRRLHNEDGFCRTRHVHRKAIFMDFGNRNRTESFLWTMVRQPTKRYLSEFFHFQVSRKKVPPSDQNVISYLQEEVRKKHYISWLTNDNSVVVEKRTTPYFRVADQILRDYDFIAVLERVDESLVCLMMLLNLPMSDILYVSSKSSGGYDDGGYRNTCVKIQKSFVSKGVESFLNSEEWQNSIGPEQALYDAASRSLDRTIDYLGRDAFEKNLALYLEAKNAVAHECLGRVTFPCSSPGQPKPNSETDCILADVGCGFHCLDRVSDEQKLW